MIGNLLRDLQLAAVPQVFGDAGGAEGVATNLRLDAGLLGSSADHSPDIGLNRPVLRNYETTPKLQT